MSLIRHESQLILTILRDIEIWVVYTRGAKETLALISEKHNTISKLKEGGISLHLLVISQIS